jgi:hypothetical protein
MATEIKKEREKANPIPDSSRNTQREFVLAKEPPAEMNEKMREWRIRVGSLHKGTPDI